MPIYKTVPRTLRFIRTDFSATTLAPVGRVDVLPPGSDSGLNSLCWVLRVAPPSPLYRPFTRGVKRGLIGPDLEMHVELWPGTERDEILAKWTDAPASFFERTT